MTVHIVEQSSLTHKRPRVACEDDWNPLVLSLIELPTAKERVPLAELALKYRLRRRRSGLLRDRTGLEEAGREAVRAQRIHVEDQAADRRRQGKEVRCPVRPAQ